MAVNFLEPNVDWFADDKPKSVCTPTEAERRRRQMSRGGGEVANMEAKKKWSQSSEIVVSISQRYRSSVVLILSHLICTQL